jgi:hypothetical protein
MLLALDHAGGTQTIESRIVLELLIYLQSAYLHFLQVFRHIRSWRCTFNFLHEAPINLLFVTLSVRTFITATLAEEGWFQKR